MPVKTTTVPPANVTPVNGELVAMATSPLAQFAADRLGEALEAAGYVLHTLRHPCHAAPLCVGLDLKRKPYPIVACLIFPSPARVAWLHNRDELDAACKGLWPAACPPSLGGVWRWSDGWPAQFNLRLRGEPTPAEAAEATTRDRQNAAGAVLRRLSKEYNAARRRWRERNV